ncbi:MAG: hypothetical protein V7776_12285 [Halopseudomonas aestusnigri]
MAQEKARALKQGLPLLQEMETGDLVDFLLQERQSFIAGLETRAPPISSVEARSETESFDEAVQLVLREQIEAQDNLQALDQDHVSKVSESNVLSIRDDAGIEPEVLDLEPIEGLLIADRPVSGSVGELEDTYPEDWPDVFPKISDGRDVDDYKNGYVDEGPPVLRADKRREVKSIGGPIGMLIGVMVLAIYILLPLLAMTTPLITPAMAWSELYNVAIASGIIGVAIFVLSILSYQRFSYAFYAGAVFFGLSYGAHNYTPVRDFIEGEKYVLPPIAAYIVEGYFRAAEYSELAEKTGAIQHTPGEAKLSLKQRQAFFEQEVEAWLEN